MTFGIRLKEIRKYNGDTQEDLARRLDFSVSTVRKWEQGAAEPGLATLKQICTLYHVSADFLIGLTEIDPENYQNRLSKLPRSMQTSLKLFEEFLSEKRDQI